MLPLTHAQSPFRTPAAPPAIPDPPLLDHYLFEAPWGPAIALAALGLAAAFALRRAGKDRPALLAAAAGLLLAALLVALAHAVTTPRETAADRTRQLVAAVARADAPAVDALLADRLSVRIGSALLPWDRDAVLLRIRRDLAPAGGIYRLKDSAASIRSLRASGEPPTILTQCRVTVTPEATAFPTSSWWLLTWSQASPDAPFLVSEIHIQQIDGMPSNFSPP